MKSNLMCIVRRCAVVLIFYLLQVKPVYAQDVSKNMLSDSSIAVINSVLHTPRFVQNTGQWPSEIHYVAQTRDGYIAFMKDSIVVHSFVHVNEVDHEIEDAASVITGTLLSRKQGRPASLRKANERLETRTSVALNRAEGGNQVLSALGERRARVNFIQGDGVGSVAFQSPTFDTLLYHNAVLGFDLYFTIQGAQLLWRFCTQNDGTPRGDDNIPEIQGMISNALDTKDSNLLSSDQFSNIGNGRIRYSSLLGGEKSDGVLGVIPLREDVLILYGTTRSLQFPISEDALNRHFTGDTSSIYTVQLFFSAIDLHNHDLLFSTYFGGSDLDGIASAFLDQNGYIVFAGTTWSNDMPTTVGAYQRQYRGNGDGYIAAIDSTGSRLIFCTYFGGSGTENLMDMKMDDLGSIVVTGLTDSWNFPTTPGVLQRNYGGGDDDIFVAKLNGDASQLLFSTYIGGSGWDEGYNLQLLGERGILIAGATNSDNFPVTPDALYPSRLGYDEGCVLILSNDGRKLVYSTYIAWDAHENVWEAYLDENNVLTTFGISTSPNLPTSSYSLQQKKGEYPEYSQISADYYILRFVLGSSESLACTYIGGSGSERYADIFQVLPDGSLLVGGTSLSFNYPVTDTLVKGSTTQYSVVLSILDSTLSKLYYSVRFGGTASSGLNSSTIYRNNVVLSGFTYSTDFPLTPDAWQTNRMGETDGFFTIFDISDFVTHATVAATQIPTDLLHSMYPNPATRSVTLPIMLSSAGHVRITIHDMLGRVVATPVDSFLPAGEHKSMFNTAFLPSGTYIVRMLSEQGQQARLMQVLQR